MANINWTYVAIGVGVLVAAVVIYLMFLRKPKEDPGKPPGPGAVGQGPAPGAGGAPAPQPQPQGPDMNAPTVILLHSHNCHHCTEYMGTWKQSCQILGPKGVQCLDLEAAHPMMAKFKVVGFPTVRFYPKGLAETAMFHEYKGDRNNPQSLVNFVTGENKP